MTLASTLPFYPWSGVAVAFAIGISAGLLAGQIMKLALRTFGHEGYVAESADERNVRIYMEKAKQGMKD